MISSDNAEKEMHASNFDENESLNSSEEEKRIQRDILRGQEWQQMSDRQSRASDIYFLGSRAASELQEPNSELVRRSMQVVERRNNPVS